MSTPSQGALPDVRLDGGEELRELVDAVPGQNVGELAAKEPILLRPLHVRLDLGAYGSDVRRGLEGEGEVKTCRVSWGQ